MFDLGVRFVVLLGNCYDLGVIEMFYFLSVNINFKIIWCYMEVLFICLFVFIYSECCFNKKIKNNDECYVL